MNLVKRETLRLRPRGQLTIPKSWLEAMGAQEGDVFVGRYEPVGNGRIILELQPTKRVQFSDALEVYIIADMKAKGFSSEEIGRMLSARKAKLEEAYAEYLRELEHSDEFEEGTDWLKN